MIVEKELAKAGIIEVINDCIKTIESTAKWVKYSLWTIPIIITIMLFLFLMFIGMP